jgi:hypothetical protein
MIRPLPKQRVEFSTTASLSLEIEIEPVAYQG